MALETDGEDSNGNLSTYALKTNIRGIDVIFPTISPQKTELFRARKRGIEINSPFATFVQHVSDLDDYMENYEIYQSDYEEFARTYQNKIVNYSFDLHPHKKTTKKVVKILRKIQINAESPFHFEYEFDIEQNEDSLIKQLDDAKTWLTEQNSNKKLVPVIDMKIQKEGLFLRKLEKISRDYDRINVVYRSPNLAQANWADLKAFLKDNKIWCHMDCVLNRYNNERIAHRVRLYAIGVLSSSVGYPFGGSNSFKKKNRIKKFNTTSTTYDKIDPPYLPTFAERQDRIWIDSLNDEILELQNMREYVKQKTFYTNYLPSNGGSNYLAFSEGI